jgi:hypothetical protein
MTQVQNGVDLSKLNGGSHGPALSPSKRKAVTPVGVGASTKAVVASHVAKAEAKRNAKPTGPSLKADAAKNEPEIVAPVEPKPDLTIGEAMGEAAEKGLLKEFVQAITGSTPVGDLPVTEDELKLALAIIERASKQQAEAIRKAAAERKKVAPEGEKVKKVKELTQAQKDKLAKAEKAAETYSVVGSAAMGLAGKGLGESTKMQTALSFVPLPALRWLAKQFEGVSIPKEKRSAADIREFLRVELLTWKAPEVTKA